MPIFKYIVFVGVSLLALIVAADHFMVPGPSVVPRDSSALEVLRKMANHGEVRGFAPLASAGPFLPMPAMVANAESAPVATTTVALAPITIETPSSTVAAATQSVLNAHASVAEAEVIDKARPAKKLAARKPKPRTVYVENTQRGQTGFFGTW